MCLSGFEHLDTKSLGYGVRLVSGGTFKENLMSWNKVIYKDTGHRFLTTSKLCICNLESDTKKEHLPGDGQLAKIY